MNRVQIPLKKFKLDAFKSWNDWFVLTAGENKPGAFNPMTVSWGFMGIMWDKPTVQVVVRPQRFTYGFIDKGDSFTLCAFPAQYKKAMGVLGSKSGRDIDKIKETGLTPIPSQEVAAPGYDEAELIIECRKRYFDDINPANFISLELDENYKQKDYHRVYFGEIVAVSGIEKYIAE